MQPDIALVAHPRRADARYARALPVDGRSEEIQEGPDIVPSTGSTAAPLTPPL
ncbi:hypothetical protein JM946_20195 [Steroidobacter sp. S1-65]|uniref:Uncharacterized protein n=1 Tax=Steroidobacter gossypii TaxID=2805490 RepID=A0ABS1X1D8_9GAMM|nr:hypothetical protein [Steroidobacter gossypii]MBM0107064.1 hypothetical protein [Steroidobacter gossypii]